MKKIFSYIFIYLCLSSCKEKFNPEIKNIDGIEHISLNNKMIRDFDRNKYSIVQKAILFKLDGKLEKAIDEFNRAENEYSNCIKLDSTYIPALLNRGLLYTHSNRVKKALLDFNNAIKLDSLEPASYLNRAILFKKTNKVDFACSDLLKAKSLDFFEKYNSNQINQLIEELNCIK